MKRPLFDPYDYGLGVATGALVMIRVFIPELSWQAVAFVCFVLLLMGMGFAYLINALTEAAEDLVARHRRTPPTPPPPWPPRPPGPPPPRPHSADSSPPEVTP